MGSTSSLSTILNHFPSCGPTQTQGSLWGAGKVHFLSSGSQSGPMPACANAATASSHFMLLLQALSHRSCLLSSQRRRGVAREPARPSVAVLELVRNAAAVAHQEPLRVVSASPSACLIDAKCTTAAVCQVNAKPKKIGLLVSYCR